MPGLLSTAPGLPPLAPGLPPLAPGPSLPVEAGAFPPSRPGPSLPPRSGAFPTAEVRGFFHRRGRAFLRWSRNLTYAEVRGFPLPPRPGLPSSAPRIPFAEPEASPPAEAEAFPPPRRGSLRWSRAFLLKLRPFPAPQGDFTQDPSFFRTVYVSAGCSCSYTLRPSSTSRPRSA